MIGNGLAKCLVMRITICFFNQKIQDNVNSAVDHHGLRHEQQKSTNVVVSIFEVLECLRLMSETD